MRKLISILAIVLGVGMLIYSGVNWVHEGFPMNDLIPYKNTFGSNPLHGVYLSLILLAFGTFEWLLQSK